MSRLPFPSNQNARADANDAQSSMKAPWKRVNPNEPPPIMFQVQFNDGRVISFAYCDLRETRMRDAGFLQLCLLGMEKYHINITGRNLTELANLMGMGRIKSFTELGARTFERPESSPSIDKITVETLTGPAY
jgi:hypothetical protein